MNSFRPVTILCPGDWLSPVSSELSSLDAITDMSALAALNQALGTPAIDIPATSKSSSETAEQGLQRRPSLTAHTISFRLGHKRQRSFYSNTKGPEIMITDPEGNDITHVDVASNVYHALLNEMERLNKVGCSDYQTRLTVSYVDTSIERMPEKL